MIWSDSGSASSPIPSNPIIYLKKSEKQANCVGVEEGRGNSSEAKGEVCEGKGYISLDSRLIGSQNGWMESLVKWNQFCCGVEGMCEVLYFIRTADKAEWSSLSSPCK